MDTISDKEIESIWQRVKKYVDTNRIKGENQKEILQNIEDFMNASSTRENRGSMRNLIRKGFVQRLPEVPTIQTELITYTRVEEKKPIVAGIKDKERELPKVRGTKNPEKIAVQTGKGTRTYSRKNIRITYSTFKGKPSYYVFNTRTKSRITWGVAE